MADADQPIACNPKFYDHEYDSLRQIVCFREVCNDKTVAHLYLRSDSSQRHFLDFILGHRSQVTATRPEAGGLSPTTVTLSSLLPP